MKFGRSLTRNTVPEWTSSYINYKGLKKLIKASIEAKKRGEEPNLPGKGVTLVVLASATVTFSL